MSVLRCMLLVVCSLCFGNGALCGDQPALILVGTRPEAIKMVPLYKELKAKGIPVVLCSTGQHAEMVNEIFGLFDVKADVDLQIMKPGQDLFYISETILHKSKEMLSQIKPKLVVVQGDTTSAFVSALAAFYLQIPVAHVEAGLRTGNIYAPFPEEMNRSLIGKIASLHFPPTELAAKNLLAEGIDSASVFVTGNTVIDALYEMRDRLDSGLTRPSEALREQVDVLHKKYRQLMLLTVHRRESWDGGVERIYQAIEKGLDEHPELAVVYPMHPNPLIHEIFQRSGLADNPRVLKLSPQPYHDLVYLLNKVDLVATDSGGIQEEAVSSGKPTLVLRFETDRPEGLGGGMATLVGSDVAKIISGISAALQAPGAFSGVSPYGDGHACKHIASIIQERYYQ